MDVGSYVLNKQAHFSLEKKLPHFTFPSHLIEHLEQHNRKGANHFHFDEGKNKPLTALGGLYRSLIAHFKDLKTVSIDVDKIRIKQVDETLFEQASQLINWAYNKRYKVEDGQYIPLAMQYIPLHKETIQTFVATDVFEGKEIVLATITLVHENEIEIFDLFDVHPEQLDDNPAEVKRFAKHPLFDLLTLSNDPFLSEVSRVYAKILTRKLWEKIGDYLTLNDLTPYYIIAPHVKEWLHATGLGPVEYVTEKMNTDGTKYQKLLEVFPHYWTKGPAVYKAPHYPLPLSFSSLEKLLSQQ